MLTRSVGLCRIDTAEADARGNSNGGISGECVEREKGGRGKFV